MVAVGLRAERARSMVAAVIRTYPVAEYRRRPLEDAIRQDRACPRCVAKLHL